MNLVLRYIVGVIVLFLYLFPLDLTFLPSFLSTRSLLAVLGVLWFFARPKGLMVYDRTCQKRWKLFLNALVLLWLAVVVSSIINLCVDGTFIIYPVTIAIYFFSCFFIISFLKYLFNDELDINSLLKLFVYSAILQCVLSLLLFFSPSFNTLLNSVIKLRELEEWAMDMSEGVKFYGVGITFFGAGVFMALALVMLGILIKYETKIVNLILSFVVLVFIFVVGSGLSRTTQIGGFIALAYVFWYKILRSENISRTKSALGLIAIVALIIVALDYVESDVIGGSSIMSGVFERGFEGVNNLITEGRYYTSSSGKTLDAVVWPDNLKSWLVGDAQFMSSDGVFYYKQTDAGYCRLVFDFGLLGLALFLLTFYRLLKVTSFDNKEQLVIYALFLICQIKGFTDISVYIFPFVMNNLFLMTPRKSLAIR